MSLKAFHAFFIVVSFIFSTYFGGWCFSQYTASNDTLMLVGAFVSFLVATGLALYLVWFLKKYKTIGFLTVAAYLLMFHPATSWACPVCIVDLNSPMVKSVNAGVWFLLAIVGSLLIAFASLFLFWRKRASQVKW